MSEGNNNQGFDTKAVRAGQIRTGEGEHSEPIFTTSSFVFDSAAQAAARFSGAEPGNLYSRFTNPTVNTFERRLAALEGGECCVAAASGMAAILSTCVALLQNGDHLVASNGIFGSTSVLFSNYLSRYGIETTFVPLTDLDAWEKAIRPNTGMLFLETPANPLGEVGDIGKLAALARKKHCILVVDNTVSTPALQRPLELGADITVLSATKYIDGQGRCVGGAVVGNREQVGEKVYGFMRTAGPSLSPFNAWIFLKGLETLSVRMQAHSERALQLAQWLEQQSGVTKVFYPGLESHPQYALARKQQTAFGGLLAFEVAGGKEQAWRFIDAMKLISITANLGDTRTTITHPGTTTHGRLTPEARAAAGIHDNLIRVAVGLEDVKDLKSDLQNGFAAIK
jgi:O-succinylhomoserine sulfhydrylase